MQLVRQPGDRLRRSRSPRLRAPFADWTCGTPITGPSRRRHVAAHEQSGSIPTTSTRGTTLEPKVHVRSRVSRCPGGALWRGRAVNDETSDMVSAPAARPRTIGVTPTFAVVIPTYNEE